MLFGAIFIAVWHSILINDPPPGAIIALSTLLILDLCLVVPILYIVWEHTPGALKLSFWTVTFCILRWSGSAAFGLWFWFHGLGAVNMAQCMEPRFCIYGCWSAYGNGRSFMKAGSICLAIGIFYFWILWIVSFVYCAFYRRGTFDERWSFTDPIRELRVSQEMDWEPVESTSGSRWLFSIKAYAQIAFELVSLIANIELEIRSNHLDGVRGVDTTGQIIPLAVGCLSLGRALALVVMWSLGALKTDIGRTPDPKIPMPPSLPRPVPPSLPQPMPPIRSRLDGRQRQSNQITVSEVKRYGVSEPWTKRSVRKGEPLPPAQASKNIFK
jgi:hypothetical protein